MARIFLAVLSLLLVLGLPVLLEGTRLTATAQEGKQPAAKAEIFVVGPFSLGEIYRQSGHSFSKFSKISGGNGVSEADIIKSLDQCKLYVIHKRVWKEKAWEFGGQPVATISGKLRHDFKDKGNPFTIRVLSVQAGADLMDYTQSPPTLRLLLSADFEIHASLGGFTNFTWLEEIKSPSYGYDMNGKTLQPRKGNLTSPPNEKKVP